nr:methionine aminopeptidase 2-like [Danio rerio]|eukprot:XP_005174657.3 methionine aminopeptidase 2-like [Danio rerio]
MEANGLPVPPVMDTLIVNGEREVEDPAKKKKRKKKKNKSVVSAGHSEQVDDGELEVKKPLEQQNLEEKEREEDGEEGIVLARAHFKIAHSFFFFTA